MWDEYSDVTKQSEFYKGGGKSFSKIEVHISQALSRIGKSLNYKCRMIAR